MDTHIQDEKLTVTFHGYTNNIQKINAIARHLDIITIADLLTFYPLRYEKQYAFKDIQSISINHGIVRLYGYLSHINIKVTRNKKKYLQGTFQDKTGSIQLIWFKKIQWFFKYLKVGSYFTITGYLRTNDGLLSVIHPHIAFSIPKKTQQFMPIYSKGDMLKKNAISNQWIQEKILQILTQKKISENLPHYVLQQYYLQDRTTALYNIHQPKNEILLQKAKQRLKFEELFYLQLSILLVKKQYKKLPAKILLKTDLLKKFYTQHLQFTLTDAQKKVIRSIYQDLKSGYQMNRLLQGDVGSGKTIVAFFSMLIAIDNGTQVVLMAPTTLLAEQHYQNILNYCRYLDITVAILTGNTKPKQKRAIITALALGNIDIIMGTHALISEDVQFKCLGLAVIDEQHRFGVKQRANLWKKNNKDKPPHMLIMTATPIPRTLAMTLYGDLDLAIIDDKPLGRIPIKTYHFYENYRLKVFNAIQKQISQGYQAYIIYPLIEESEKLQYKYLIEGYEAIKRFFKDIPISIVHGKMHAQDKAQEMEKFVQGKTKIMVSTTVIEVGIHVDNATVILIENAERFGLAQLHQLRGRVGRSQKQSYCYLMTDYKISSEGKSRMQIMVQTQDGFKIAQEDMNIRGPGDIMGTQQSGIINLKIADICTDESILLQVRAIVQKIIAEDACLTQQKHSMVKSYMNYINQKQTLAKIG